MRQCGLCQEPLAVGATTCPRCGLPVAPTTPRSAPPMVSREAPSSSAVIVGDSVGEAIGGAVDSLLGPSLGCDLGCASVLACLSVLGWLLLAGHGRRGRWQ